MDLNVAAWRLAHAIKKADCTRGIPPIALHLGALGFLVEYSCLFDWNADNLRLNNGMADFYSDFTRTGLAGRVGQGMTMLFMEEMGYSYGGRFSTFLKSARGQAAANKLLKEKTVKRLNPKTPDFIFEKNTQEMALAESKGGFVSPGNTSDIKGDLRDALTQLEGWDRIFVPQPSKSFAIGTYLKETDDPSVEPSLIAFVDPAPDEPTEKIEYPRDLIRRCNYAGWLSGMGFDSAANRLRGRRETSALLKRNLAVLTLGNRRYAFVVLAVEPGFHEDASFDEIFWSRLEDLFYGLPPFIKNGASLEIMGLDLEILQSLIKYLHIGKEELIMHIEPIFERDMPQAFKGPKFIGSFFSDGTLYGELRISSATFEAIKFEEVIL
jgi:hypothetical protein